ncbi:FecR family protein [Pseudomonas viridiflava]|uniref:FecR family protein n=1 Tax=Pseudomonas viridiflava TaxID=33069 RepID=UPI003D33D79B
MLSDRVMDQALSWLIELDGSDEQQQARFQNWLMADPAHREAFNKVQAIWHSQPVTQAAVELAAIRPSRWRRLRPHWIKLGTAAVLLIGLFSFSNLGLRLQADHLTVVGERQRLQLDDGSKVLLNTNSAFSSKATDTNQVAKLLQGEAFFEVPASQGQPLEVLAGAVSMRASGSAFAVRYLNGIAQIQVQRGALDVRAPQSNEAVKLAGGDSIRVGPEGFSHRQKLDQTTDLAWVQGRLVFDNCPLGEVLAELRRYYPGWIINTNSKLESVAVTGNYRLDNPMEVVRSLAHITAAQMHELPALVILN